MSKRDAFAEISVDAIRALGSDAMPELIAIVEERADALDTTFDVVARRLPDGWRQIVFAAHAIEGIEEEDSFAGAFADLRRERDVIGVEVLLKELGAVELARSFAYARQQTAVLEDDDMDPLDIEELRDISAHQLDLPGVRRALVKRASAMTRPFPAAD